VVNYEKGIGGLPIDKAKAIHWFREAMRPGYADAAELLRALGAFP